MILNDILINILIFVVGVLTTLLYAKWCFQDIIIIILKRLITTFPEHGKKIFDIVYTEMDLDIKKEMLFKIK